MDTEMEFNVAQLMKEPVGGKRKYEFGTPELRLSEALAGDPTDLVARNVQGTVTLTRLGAKLRAQGAVEADVDLQCSRCLEPFTIHVQAPLEELFRQTIDVVSGHPLPQEAGDDDLDVFDIDQNHIVDLTEPVRQALLVALPMRPLHSEDCRGLCPICGTNLNLAQCDCVAEDADPRLAALASLLTDDTGSGSES